MLQDRYRRAGDEIRRLRLARGLSQEELAHRAGMSAKTVSRAEDGGGHEHRGSTYRRLAEALEVPPERLLGIIFSEDDPPPSRADLDAAHTTETELPDEPSDDEDQDDTTEQP